MIHSGAFAKCQSVKGVGAVTISTLIAELPERGKLNRGEVAKLVTILNLIVKSNQIWQTKMSEAID